MTEKPVQVQRIAGYWVTDRLIMCALCAMGAIERRNPNAKCSNCRHTLAEVLELGNPEFAKAWKHH